MTVNLLVLIFFGLFVLFLFESIYFLRKRLSVTTVQISQEQNQQNSGKIILIGGILLVIAIIATFAFFLTKQNEPQSPTLTEIITPTSIPTQILPSPTPKELVYNLPTITNAPEVISPTSNIKTTPTKTPTPTKIPTLTKTPTPTKSLTPTVSQSSLLLKVTPTKSPPIGGPGEVTPTSTPTPTQIAEVIVPKMPVAGSITQTLTMFFLGLSAVLAGLIL